MEEFVATDTPSEADLLEAVVEAARTPGRAVLARRRGTAVDADDFDMDIVVEVDRAPGGSHAALILPVHKGPTPREARFVLESWDPASAGLLLAELAWMFDQWNVDYTEPMRFEAGSIGIGDPESVDEDWQHHATPGDVAARLRAACAGRGGCVVIGLPGRPSIVVR